MLGFAGAIFQEHVPGAEGQAHRTIPNGGHFIREEESDALVEVILGVSR